MKMRTGVLVVVSALSLAALPARAEDRHRDPIRSLYRAVAALNARVSKLEGNIEAADLAGTYGLVIYSGNLAALVTNPGPPPTVAQNAGITHDVLSGTVTVDADGTGSLTLTLNGFVLTQGTWAVAARTFSGSETFTWTYANGVVAMAFEDGSSINLNVGPGGRLMVGVLSEFHADRHEGETDLVILTRL